MDKNIEIYEKIYNEEFMIMTSLYLRLEKDFPLIQYEDEEILINISEEYNIKIISDDFSIILSRFDKIENRELEEDLSINIYLFDEDFLYKIIKESILRIKEY